MKRKPALMPQSDALLTAPAYPYTANQVFRRLKESLAQAEGRLPDELTLKQMGQIIGAPRSTIHDWYHGELPKPMKHFLCAIERLSANQQTVLWRNLCRDCPRLDHPRLAHDEPAVNTVRSLLLQRSGLTIISGADDNVRTFLITAMGNTAVGFLPLRAIAGVDAHRPDRFVPVPGVVYLRNPEDVVRAKQLVEQHWHRIEDSSATLVLLNRVWSLMPGLRTRIEALARRKHMVVADEISVMPKGQPHLASTIVSVTAATGRLIRVQVEALDADR